MLTNLACAIIFRQHIHVKKLVGYDRSFTECIKLKFEKITMKLCISNVSGNHYVESEDVENSYWLYCLTAAQIVQITQPSY